MNADAVQGLLVATLAWYLLTEGLHSGVAASGLVRRDALDPEPWVPLGPLVLIDEVWLVVVLALAATGFPATDNRAWAQAAPTLLAALTTSFAQFALLLLGPIFARPERIRRALIVLGCVVPFCWALALGDVAGASWLGASAYGVGALVATLVLGVGFVELPTRAGSARWWRPVAGAGLLALLIGSAITLAPSGVLTATGDTATLRLLAYTTVVILPGLCVLQVFTWRWALRRWIRGQVLVPIHARGRTVHAALPTKDVGGGR